MSKIKNLLSGLKQAQELLNALEALGIDIPKLIAISNAQGPQGKLIQNILSHPATNFPDEQDLVVDFSGPFPPNPRLVEKGKRKKTRKPTSKKASTS